MQVVVAAGMGRRVRQDGDLGGCMKECFGLFVGGARRIS